MVKRSLVSAVVASMVLTTVLSGCGTRNQTNQTQGSGQAPQLKTASQQWSTPPKMSIDKNKQYDAVVHTNYGTFTIRLFAKQSPVTVNNFVFLAKHHFYHDNQFFRIMQSFMIQTGDPTNTGTGGPGYQFQDELPPKEKYAPGIVAMANAGPNTNGSQFFIGTGPDVTQLNKTPKYTIFGKVTKGMSVVEKIAAIPVKKNPQTNEPSDPTKTAYMKSVDIQVH